jgi:hypothetical protein
LVQSKQELVHFLKERSLLKVLDERVLSALGPLFQEMTCKAGQIIFAQGDDADSIYILKEGSVEVLQGDNPPKVIAFLTTGDCFGEMAAYNEKKRTATIRVPEKATVLKLPLKAFDELQAYFPEVTTEVIHLINRRLTNKVTQEIPGLQGDLSLFDLATVIQTVLGSRQIGVLTLRARVGKLAARINMRHGKIMQVTFGHLNGEPAFFELLTHNIPMDFVFEPRSEDDVAAIDRALSSKQPHLLLIEGARRADELPKLMMKLKWPGAIYRQSSQQVDWSKLSEDSPVLARKIWLLLEARLTVQQMTEKLAYDRYAVLSCLAELLDKEFIVTKDMPTTQPKASSAPTPAQQLDTIAFGLNGVFSSTAILIGKEKVARLIQKAVDEAINKFPLLGKVPIDMETPSLDVKGAAKDLLQSEDSLKALELVFYNFLFLVAQERRSEDKK